MGLRGVFRDWGEAVTRSKVVAALRLALLPVLVAVAALVAWKLGYFDLDHRRTLVRAVQGIRDIPSVHVAFVAAFAVVIALCLPFNVGTWVAGAVFGVWMGAALALASGLVATVLAYWLARTVAKRPMQRLFGEHHLMRKLKDNDGVLQIFQLRVIPIAPFAVFTYVAGIAGTSLRRQLLATAMASVPTCLGHAFVGTQLLRGLSSQSGDARRALVLAAAITIFMLLMSLGIGIIRRNGRPH